jgi:hypothetical protein
MLGMLFWRALEVTFSPALALLVFFGYVHPKTREIWFYAFLMWLPKLTKVVAALPESMASGP